MSCAERQGCLERKTVFKREQADAEASCEAPITQLEDADEPLQQPPQRSSQRMCKPPASITLRHVPALHACVRRALRC